MCDGRVQAQQQRAKWEVRPHRAGARSFFAASALLQTAHSVAARDHQSAAQSPRRDHNSLRLRALCRPVLSPSPSTCAPRSPAQPGSDSRAAKSPALAPHHRHRLAAAPSALHHGGAAHGRAAAAVVCGASGACGICADQHRMCSTCLPFGPHVLASRPSRAVHPLLLLLCLPGDRPLMPTGQARSTQRSCSGPWR